MKSKMKSAFAIIAVALMIMVAVVPMVGVFTEDSEAAASELPTTPTSAATTGLKIKVTDATNAYIPYAAISVGSEKYYANASGEITLAWDKVKGKTVEPTNYGTTANFAFDGQKLTVSDDADTTVTQTFTFKAKETLVVVDAKAKSGEVITKGTIGYGYDVTGSSATIYKVGTAYKAYLAKGVATSADAKFKINLTSGCVGDLSGFDSEAADDMNVTAKTYTVTAKQSKVTITFQDNAGVNVRETPSSVTIADKENNTISYIGVYEEAKAILSFEMPSGSGNGYKVTAASVGSYTFEPQANVQTSTTPTLKANEKTYNLTFTGKGDSNALLNGSVTVNYTSTLSTSTLVTASVVKGKAEFPIPKDATAIGISATLYDDANQSMAFTELSDKTLNDLNKTYQSDDKAFKISGKVYFSDGKTLVKSVSPGVEVKFGPSINGFNATNGTYELYIKEGSTGELKAISTGGMTFTVTSEMFTVSSAYARDFIADQTEKYKVEFTLVNSAGTNIGGTAYEINLVNGTTKTKMSFKDGKYTADLVRGQEYKLDSKTVGADIKSIVGKNSIVDDSSTTVYNVGWSENDATYDIKLVDVEVSGHVYAKYIAGDDNARPFANKEVKINGVSKTLDENGYFDEVAIPHGVKFQIISEDSSAGAGYYWTVDVNALGDVAEFVISDTLGKVKYDVVGYVYANSFGAGEKVPVKVTGVTLNVKLSGTTTSVAVTNTYADNSFSFNLNEARGQKVDIEVTAVTADGYTFGTPFSWTGVELKDGGIKLEDKVIAKERAYSGKVETANGYGLNGTITFIPSPSGVTKTAIVKDGAYVLPIDVTSTTEQLYKVSFNNGINIFTIWDGKYDSALFRTAFIPGATQTADKVVSGTLAADGKYVDSVNNANYVTKEYVIAGKAISSTATTETPIVSLNLVFTMATKETTPGTVTSNVTTDANGKFYGFINAENSAKLTKDTVVNVKTDGTQVHPIVDLKEIKLSSASSIVLKINDKKTFDLELKDAFGNIVKDEVAVTFYKVGEPIAYGTVTFKDGKATFDVAFDNASATDIKLAVIAKEGTYSLETDATETFSSTSSDVVILTTVEGKVTGKVAYTNDATVKIDGTIVIKTDAVANADIKIEKGAYSGIIKKGTAYTAYIKGGDYAFFTDGNLTISDAGAVEEKIVDLRTVSGVLKDGQDKALADMDLKITASGKEFVAKTDGEGAYSFKLADDMAIASISAVTVKCVFNESEDIYTIDGTPAITYTGKNTAKNSTLLMNDLKTNENRVIVTFEGDKVDGIDVSISGYRYGATDRVLIEKFSLKTDKDGKIVIDGAHVAASVPAEGDVAYVVSIPENGVMNLVYESTTIDISFVVVEGIAYLNSENIAKNMELSFIYDGVTLTKITTGEDGKYSIKLPVAYVDNDISIVSGDYETSAPFKKVTAINVPTSYKFVDGIDFGAIEVNGIVEIPGISSEDYPMSEQKIIMKSGEIVLTVTTDKDGKYSFIAPSAYNGRTFTFTLEGTEYTIANAPLASTMSLMTNEGRLYVPVASDGDAVAGAKVQTSLDGVLYRTTYNVVDGIAVVDYVVEGMFIRAIAPGYAFSDAVQFDGDAVSFSGIVDLKKYTVCIGDQTIEAKDGDSVFVSYNEGGVFVKNGDTVVSELDLGVAVNKIKFCYWKLADGTTSTDEAITFVVGGDAVKAVGNMYSFMPVFESEISTDDVSGESDNGINPTVLILGIAAVIVALIAVVYTVIQKKE
ncbi:hypothetical protein [Candidatus Methanarcanum hacksteinii]|uniref:hypothetical protein n=1 Tax=Candidatus Methanarcanum hacksteinii TaxID=2911857 RepID=UPI0037DD8F29